jgi:thiol-disulfide isomerase/thioredoxin
MSVRRLVLPCLLVLVVALAQGPSVDAANVRGVKAPEIAITDGINGVTAKTSITDYKGSVTLFVIWLPVCPHCKKFMPEVARLHAKYAQKGLRVLTVTHGKKDYTARYLADRKWTFGVGFDWTGVTGKRYGLKGLPGVYLLGADNHLRYYRGTLEQAIVDELAATK